MSNPLERLYSGSTRRSRFDKEDTDISKYYNSYDDGSVWDKPTPTNFMDSMYGSEKQIDPLSAPRNKINTYGQKLTNVGVTLDAPDHIEEKSKYGLMERVGDAFNVAGTPVNVASKSVDKAFEHYNKNMDKSTGKIKDDRSAIDKVIGNLMNTVGLGALVPNKEVAKEAIDTGVSSLTGAFVKPFADEKTREWYRENDHNVTQNIDNAREGKYGDIASMPVKGVDSVLSNTAGRLVNGVFGDNTKEGRQAVGEFMTDFLGGALIEGNVDFGDAGKAMSYMKNVRSGKVDDIAKAVTESKAKGAFENVGKAEIDNIANKEMIDGLRSQLSEAKTRTTNSAIEREATSLFDEATSSRYGMTDKDLEDLAKNAKEEATKKVTDNLADNSDQVNYLFRKTKDSLGDYDFEGLSYMGKTIISKDRLAELAKKNSTYRMTQAGLLVANPFSGIYSMGKGNTQDAISRLSEGEYKDNFTGQAKKTVDKALESLYDNFAGGKDGYIKKTGIIDKNNALNAQALSDELNKFGFKNQKKLVERLTEFDNIKKKIEKEHGNFDSAESIRDIVEKPFKTSIVDEATGELDYTNAYKTFMSKKNRSFLNDMWKKTELELEINGKRTNSKEKFARQKELEATKSYLEKVQNLVNSDDVSYKRQIEKVMSNSDVPKEVLNDVKLNNVQFTGKRSHKAIATHIKATYGDKLGNSTAEQWAKANELANNYKIASESTLDSVKKFKDIKDDDFDMYSKKVDFEKDVIEKYNNAENVIGDEKLNKINKDNEIRKEAFKEDLDNAHNELMNGTDSYSKGYKKSYKDANVLEKRIAYLKSNNAPEKRIKDLENDLSVLKDKMELQKDANIKSSYEPKTKAQLEEFQMSYNKVDYNIDKLEAEQKRLSESNDVDKEYKMEYLQKEIDKLNKEKEGIKYKEDTKVYKNKEKEEYNVVQELYKSSVDVLKDPMDSMSEIVKKMGKDGEDLGKMQKRVLDSERYLDATNVKRINDHMYRMLTAENSDIYNHNKQIINKMLRNSEDLRHAQNQKEMIELDKVKRTEVKEDLTKFDEAETKRFEDKQNKTMYEEDADTLKTHKGRIKEIESMRKEALDEAKNVSDNPNLDIVNKRYNDMISKEVDKFVNDPSTPKEVIDKLANNELYKTAIFESRNAKMLKNVENFITGKNINYNGNEKARLNIVKMLKEKYDFIQDDGSIKAKTYYTTKDGRKLNSATKLKDGTYVDGNYAPLMVQRTTKGERYQYVTKDGEVIDIKTNGSIKDDPRVIRNAKGKYEYVYGDKVEVNTSYPKDNIIKKLNEDLKAISNSNKNYDNIKKSGLFNELRTLYTNSGYTKKMFGDFETMSLAQKNLNEVLDETTKIDVNMQRNYFNKFQGKVNKETNELLTRAENLVKSGEISRKTFDSVYNSIQKYKSNFNVLATNSSAMDNALGTIGDINKRGVTFDSNMKLWADSLDNKSMLEKVYSFNFEKKIKNANKDMLYIKNKWGITGVDQNLTPKQMQKALNSVGAEFTGVSNVNFVKDIGSDGLKAGNAIYVDPTKRNTNAILGHEFGHIVNNYNGKKSVQNILNGFSTRVKSMSDEELNKLVTFINRHGVNKASSDVAMNMTNYVDSLRKNGAEDVVISREMFSEIASLALNQNKKVRENFLKQMPPNFKEEVYGLLLNNNFKEIKDFVAPTWKRGSEEYAKRIESLQTSLKDMEKLYTKGEFFEDKIKMNNLLADEDFAEMENIFKTHDESFRLPDGVSNEQVARMEEVSKIIDRTKDLNGVSKELYDYMSKTFADIGIEEKVVKPLTLAMKEYTDYTFHMLNTEYKDNKAVSKIYDALKGNKGNLNDEVRNAYSKKRTLEGTINEINEMTKDIPELKALGVDKLFETSVEKIMYRRLMDSNKIVYDKTAQQMFYDTMGHKTLTYKDFNDLIDFDEVDEFGLKHMSFDRLNNFLMKNGIDTEGIYEGYNKVDNFKKAYGEDKDVGIQVNKKDGITDQQKLNAKWNGYQKWVADKINSGNYEFIKLNERIEKTNKKVINDKDFENAVNNKTEAFKEDLSGTNANNEVLKYINDIVDETGIDSDYLRIDNANLKTEEIQKYINDGYIIIDKNINKRYQELSKTQFNKDKTAFRKILDTFGDVFKASALFSPSFHYGNAIGNTLRSYSEIGYNIFDPRKIKDATLIFNGKSPTSKIKNGMTFKEVKDSFDELGGEGTGMYGNMFNEFTDKFRLLEGKKAPSKLSKVNPFSKSFKPYELSTKFGEQIEGNARLINYITHLENGATPQEAMDRVNKALFDYSDLTSYENGVMKTVAPFYTFMAKNTKAQLESLANNPKEARLYSIMRDISNSNESEEDKALAPEYMREGISLGNGMYLKDRTPFKNLLEMTNPKAYVGALNPLPKSVMEYMTNTKAFNGAKVSQFNNPMEKLKYVVESNAPIVKQFNDVLGLNGSDYEKNKSINSIDSKWFLKQVDTYDKQTAMKSSMDKYAEKLNEQYFKEVYSNEQLRALEEYLKQQKSQSNKRQTRRSAISSYKNSAN